MKPNVCVCGGGGGGGRTKKFIMPGQEFILVSNSEGRA